MNSHICKHPSNAQGSLCCLADNSSLKWEIFAPTPYCHLAHPAPSLRYTACAYGSITDACFFGECLTCPPGRGKSIIFTISAPTRIFLNPKNVHTTSGHPDGSMATFTSFFFVYIFNGVKKGNYGITKFRVRSALKIPCSSNLGRIGRKIRPPAYLQRVVIGLNFFFAPITGQLFFCTNH